MSVAPRAGNGKVTVPDILSRKSQSLGSLESNDSKRKISCLTAYDYPTARLLDEAGVDVLLVGDSLGMAVLGYDSTLPVTVDDIVYHTRAVRRGTRRALLVADMPYGSFHVSIEESIRNAVRLVKEGGAEAVKIEGGERRIELIARLVEAEIPVMGHIGLTPQSFTRSADSRSRARQPKPPARSSATRARWKRREPFPWSSNPCRAISRPASPRNFASPPSASAPAPIATVRSSCFTISWGSPSATSRNLCGSMRICPPKSRAPFRRIVMTFARAASLPTRSPITRPPNCASVCPRPSALERREQDVCYEIHFMESVR